MLFFLGLFVLALLAFLVLLQTSNLWKSFSVESASDTLLIYALSSLNFIAFVIFGFIFLRSIIKLAKERRTLQLGSKIKTRLLWYFAAVSLLPILAMAGFSYLFMNRALERWFTQIPENVVRKALDVQNEAVADQSRELSETALMLAALLDRDKASFEQMHSIAAAGNLTVAAILDKNGRPIIWVEEPVDAERKTKLDSTVGLIKSGSFDAPELFDGRGFDVAIAPMTGDRTLVIVPNLREGDTVSRVVENSLLEFDRLKEQQLTVRQIGFLTLGGLTFLLIFASSWTAFYIARGLTVPIRALAEGADQIAKGNLSHRVQVDADDELAILVESFNQMSSRLEANSAALSEGRRYIETVLQSLPTGVISFDSADRVSTINRAAKKILRLENADFGQFDLKALVNEENRAVIERLLARAKRIGHAAEQTVLRRENVGGLSNPDANIPVALIATVLPNDNGAVLVIEDLSELIAAQRASAWQEVARRMAHEIKNPLTPIQLSAERIAKRFSMDRALAPSVASSFPSESDAANKVVREGTDTILREVHSLKSMVDEFSRFARLPSPKLEAGDLNEIVGQVAQIYEDRFSDVEIEFRRGADLPYVMLDSEQLKRVFVNLIENSIEAFDHGAAEKRIVVNTRYDVARDLVLAEVTDNGRGINAADFQKLFQPYFSTKGRGTGLGLAIVDRIVTEHHGKIRVSANQPKGAKFMLEFPVAAN